MKVEDSIATAARAGLKEKGRKAAPAAKAAEKKERVASKKASRPKAANGEARETKKAIVLDLLRRKDGATIADIAKATNWQNHSIRGFMSGSLTKKMGLAVESSKNEAGERTYRII